MSKKNKKKDVLDLKIDSRLKDGKEDGTLPKDIPEEVKEKLNKLRKKIDILKKRLTKQFDKHLIAMALLPPPKQEQNLPQDKIYLLSVFDDSDSKLNPFELKSKLAAAVEKTAKETDENLVINTMLLSEISQNLMDGKYELLELIAMSAPLHDPKDLLAALKVSEIHKSMVLKKFDKYIVSYVAAGSLFRGEKSNDIDVFVIVDDTDVKKMTRYELREKLRAIIVALSFQAAEIAQVKKQFHVQVYILTDFWDGIKDANPVFFTLLRDGIPLFDKGVFVPWKLLLQMGKIRPSQESIDLFMTAGEKMLERVRFKLNSIILEDIYWSTLSTSQAALMLYGVPPPTPKETVALLDAIFVKKEKIMQKSHIHIMEKIRKYYKGLEHGQIKEVKGNEVEKLIQDSKKYLNEIKKLFEIIQKKKEQESVIEIYENCVTLLKDALKLTKKPVTQIEDGLRQLVKEGELPEKSIRLFAQILKLKKDYNRKKLSKQDIENIKKNAKILVNSIILLIERHQTKSIEKAKLRIRQGDKKGEVIILENCAYIIPDMSKKDIVLKAELKNNRLTSHEKVSKTELERVLKAIKIPENVFIQETIFEDLKKILGSNIEIMISS